MNITTTNLNYHWTHATNDELFFLDGVEILIVSKASVQLRGGKRVSFAKIESMGMQLTIHTACGTCRQWGEACTCTPIAAAECNGCWDKGCDGSCDANQRYLLHSYIHAAPAPTARTIDDAVVRDAIALYEAGYALTPEQKEVLYLASQDVMRRDVVIMHRLGIVTTLQDVMRRDVIIMHSLGIVTTLQELAH